MKLQNHLCIQNLLHTYTFDTFEEGFMDILIPKVIIEHNELGKYRTLSYIFLKLHTCTNGNVVCFTLDEFYKECHITRNTQRETNTLARQSLQNVIDLISDKEKNVSFYKKEINTDVISSTAKQHIFFSCKDKYLGSKRNNFIVLKLQDIESIIDYSINLSKTNNVKVSYAADLINIYCYMISRMAHRRLKNEDGTTHYSNNPIYFYSYKNNILKDLEMDLVYFNRLFEMLSNELHLLREVKFKKQAANEMGQESYFMNFPNFYFIKDDELEENLRNAIKKYCNEKQIDKKKFKPIFK